MSTFLVDKTRPPIDTPAQSMPTSAKEGKDAKKEAQAKAAKGKKDQKEQGPVLEAAQINWEGNSREITSFKTFRQKSCHEWSNKVFEEVKQKFDETVKFISNKFDTLKENELKYQFQWERSIDEIFHRA